MAYKTFGESFKAHRLNLQMSLRQFCQENDLDPANISKIERNILAPPKAGKKLRAYAQALKLVEGTEQYTEFFDLAAAVKGEFPPDLQDAELLTQLPALFRTMRGEAPSDEQLEHIIELLRKR